MTSYDNSKIKLKIPIQKKKNLIQARKSSKRHTNVNQFVVTVKFATIMTILATCGASIKFHCWPSGVHLGSFDVGDGNLSVRNISWCNTGEHLVAVPSNGIPLVIRPPEGGSFASRNAYSISAEIVDAPKVTAADFSRTENSHVVLGTHTGDVYVYDLEQKLVVDKYPSVPQEIKFLQFSRQDALLAAGSGNDQIILYNSRNIVCASFMLPTSFNLSAMSFHQNNSNLLGSGSKEGIVCVWNTDSGNTILSGQHHDHCVSDVAFYPNGQLFASVGMDQKFMCHDLRTPEFVHCLELERELASVAFMPDGDELAIASSDGHLYCYDRRNLQVPILTVVAHKKQIKKIAFQRYSFNGSCYSEELIKVTQPMDSEIGPVENKIPGGIEMNIKEETDHQKIVKLAEMQDARDDLLDSMKVKCKQLEAQMDDCFFKMRIDISKLFIGLEEHLERNKDAFINILTKSSKSFTKQPQNENPRSCASMVAKKKTKFDSLHDCKIPRIKRSLPDGKVKKNY